jgi:hypothetical protein
MKENKELYFKSFKGIATLDFNVNKDSNFIIISYWWGRGNINKNSRKQLTYEQLADRLISDCYKTKCNYCFVEIPEFAVPGGYQKSINFKARFIKEFIENYLPKHIVNVLYIDTDMSVKKHPYIFELIGYDFMGYNWNWEPRQMYNRFPSDCWDPFNLYTSGGILMFANTKESLNLLEKWDLFIKKYPGKAEDRLISIPFNDEMMITKLRCLWLPNEYFWIPYFYELSDEFEVSKKYQLPFKKFGLKFKQNFTEEINFKDFFNTRTYDLVITHPEMLTSDEIAAMQGADLNRVPIEWYKSQGRKKRCLTRDKIYTINENLYVENSKQKNAVKFNLEWLKNSKFINLTDKSLSIKPIELKILEKNIKVKDDFIFLGIVKNKHKDYDIDNWFKIVNNHSFVLVYNKESLAKVIYSVMKKFNKSIVNLALECELKSDFKIDFIDVDLACLNSNAFPYYKSSLKEKCKDDRILNCVTVDFIYFKNNRFGKNILKAWNSESSRKSSEEYSLSVAFNKYLLVIPSRCKWLNPGFAYNKKYISYNKGYEVKITTTNNYPSFKSKNIVNNLEQCGEKRAIEISESARSSHYTGSKFRAKLSDIF